MNVLESARLALRRLTPEDAPFILELLNDPLFLRFVGDKGVRTLDGARDYIVNGPMASYAQHGFGLFHVSLKPDGTPIGMCGLLKREVLEDVDVGFAYLPRFSGQGYATEAARATIDYGRAVLDHCAGQCELTERPAENRPAPRKDAQAARLQDGQPAVHACDGVITVPPVAASRPPG